MGDGQNLIDKILSDARAQADEVRAQAKEEAEEIIAAAKAKAGKEKAKFDENASLEAQKAAAKEISAAEMQAKKLILSQKQECLEEILDEAEKKLGSLTGAEYENVIIGMIKRADIEEGSEIIFSKKDKDAFGKKVSDMGFCVSDDVRDIEGGFVVKKGDIEYNYSFKSIISVEREDILQLAAGILFA
ncbi:V-type ATP synthase subunit E [Lachnospiraceae bacterium NSJ-143]|nr:V-type ATP synthase subunit E [Lachnospiraceae bacterium NSJ-143]